MSEERKPASGLQASAVPFVPKDKPAAPGVATACVKSGPAANSPTTSSTPPAADTASSASNGTISLLSGTEKSSSNSNAGKSAHTAAGKGHKQGTAAAAAATAKQSPVTSKLAAAASAAPFVPASPSGASESPPAAAKSAAAAALAATAAVTGVQQPTATPNAVPAAAKDIKQPSKQAARSGGKQQQQQGRQQQSRQQQQQQQQQQKDAKETHKDGKDQQQHDQKEQKDAKASAGKMSAAAAAFVPKAAQPAAGAAAGGGGGGGGGAPSSAGSGAAAGSAPTYHQQQQQQSRSQNAAQGASAAAAAAARLKSPLKGSSSSSSNAAGGTSAAGPSPARGSATAGSGTRQPNRAGQRPEPSTAGGLRTQQQAPHQSPGIPAGGPMYSGIGAGGSGGTSIGVYGGRGMQQQGLAGVPGQQSSAGPRRALLAQFRGSYPQGYGGGGSSYGAFQHQHFHGLHHHHHHHHGRDGGKQLLAHQFMSEGLRQQLQHRNYLIQLQYTPTGDEPPLPDKIGPYHTLYPLEELSPGDNSVSAAWGVRTTVLKGICARDGQAYALRIICGKQVIPSLEMLSVVRQAVEAWGGLAGHPGLLVPVEGLVASELDGSPSLVVVHAYIPGAVTLAQAHLQPTQTVSGQLVHNTPNEELLWSYTVQLSAILRAVHSMGLVLRPAALSATKVLLTPVGRLKISGLGVAEALTGEVVPSSSEDLQQLQRDDVAAMGQLLLQLACAAGTLPSASLDFASLHYSHEFVRLLVLLLGVAEGGAFSWRAVSALLGERLLLETDTLAMFNEQLLDDLSKEMDNGRLFRLVCKLSFVVDRASDGSGAAGAVETGNRYLLQLFRDFVYHQGEQDGCRLLDWGHTIECLNKLDAGVSEQILLQSRDERSLLVVTYADVKRCIEAAIAEIRSGGGGPAGSHGHLGHHAAAAAATGAPMPGGSRSHVASAAGGMGHMFRTY